MGSEWISVEERLPEDRVRVLTFSNYEWGHHVGWLETDMGNKRHWCNSFDHLPYVTHWMPLPEPPQTGGSK